MTQCDRYMMGNLYWQARHLATLVDHTPTFADVQDMVRQSTTVHVTHAQIAKLWDSAKYAYMMHCGQRITNGIQSRSR